MRILFVNSHGADPAYGGAERYVWALATGMSARGHAATVLSAFPERGESGLETRVLHATDWREDRGRRLRNHVGDVVSAPWPRLSRMLREMDPDLVHTNNLPGIGTGVWEAARRAGIPVVHTLHDYYLRCPRTTLTRRDGSPCSPSPLLCGARSRRLARWHRAVGGVIGVSDHVLSVHAGMFPDSTPYVMRPPIRPFDVPPPPVRTPPTTFGYLGALRASKGIFLLLGAAPALAERGVTLRLAGDGPLRSEVEASEHVEYVGRLGHGDLIAFLGSCDGGIVPSLWDEPGPLVVCEWLAAGRPVLATHRGGLAEARQRGGLATIEESSEALVDTVLRLSDPGEWRRLLETLPAVDGDADARRWLDEHEEAFEAAVEAGAGRRSA